MDLYFGIKDCDKDWVGGFKLSDLKVDKEIAIEKVLENKDVYLRIFEDATDMEVVSKEFYEKIVGTDE